MYKEFTRSTSSCVTTEFGTNQHSWKVGNSFDLEEKLPNLPAGSTGRHWMWMWETTQSLSHLHHSFLFKPEAAEAPFFKKKSNQSKQKSPG